MRAGAEKVLWLVDCLGVGGKCWQRVEGSVRCLPSTLPIFNRLLAFSLSGV